MGQWNGSFGTMVVGGLILVCLIGVMMFGTGSSNLDGKVATWQASSASGQSDALMGRDASGAQSRRSGSDGGATFNGDGDAGDGAVSSTGVRLSWELLTRIRMQQARNPVIMPHGLELPSCNPDQQSDLTTLMAAQDNLDEENLSSDCNKTADNDVSSDVSSDAVDGQRHGGKRESHAIDKDDDEANSGRVAGTRDRKQPVIGCQEGVNQRKRVECVSIPPRRYRTSIDWPESLDAVWAVNIPDLRGERIFTDSKVPVPNDDDVAAVLVQDKWEIRGRDSFSRKYEKIMEDIMALIHPGSRTRTALDVGSGFGEWAASLWKKNVVTLSLGVHSANESLAQLVLERGLPAVVYHFGSKRTPFPSQGFDLIRCKQCEFMIENDFLLLIEMDRLLRPGGFFVWDSPLTDQWPEISAAAAKLCWTLQKSDLSVGLRMWEKPKDQSCLLARSADQYPPICEHVARDNSTSLAAWPASLRHVIIATSSSSPSSSPLTNPDGPYGAPLVPCLMEYPKSAPEFQLMPYCTELDTKYFALRKREACAAIIRNRRWGVNELPDWPTRANALSVRVDDVPTIFSAAAQIKADYKLWIRVTAQYYRGEGRIPRTARNVLDMNSYLGGFAAALANRTLWVMNVVPVSSANTLPLILDRGFIGMNHDWCKPFPVYPRSYDVVHAKNLFSQEWSRCSAMSILLEIDRIVRPDGCIIIRDKMEIMLMIKDALPKLRWNVRLSDGDNGPLGSDKYLRCRKQIITV